MANVSIAAASGIYKDLYSKVEPDFTSGNRTKSSVEGTFAIACEPSFSHNVFHYEPNIEVHNTT